MYSNICNEEAFGAPKMKAQDYHLAILSFYSYYLATIRASWILYLTPTRYI